MENEFQSAPLKQTQEAIFSRKKNTPHHSDIIFNRNPVKQSSYQKHLRMFLDSKLDIDEHIKGVFDKTINLLVLFASSDIFY